MFSSQSLFGGGVVLDGSFGTRGPLPGPNFMITANMGKLVNTNLFQSFSQFNLNSSQSATFTGPANVQNILARVTSGSPSSIDGRISSDIHGANLFFMNPAGVLFGQHAQLDVSGSFAVTTANYLKLVGGGRFNANLGGGDVLTSAPVSAFGFLNAAPAPVSIANATLNVASGKSFSVVAGDITLDGTQLSAPRGNVSLFSARATGEVLYDPSDPGAHFRDSSLSAFGDITLKGGATVAIDSSEDGGKVTMRAGQLAVTDFSTISASSLGAGNGGDINIDAKEALTLSLGGTIRAFTFSGGNGGTVSVHAGSLSIDGLGTTELTGIRTDSAGDATGDAADVTITVEQALSIVGGEIDANTFTTGNGGNVSIHAGLLSIDGSGTPNFTGIRTDSAEPKAGHALHAGHAGDVTITVEQALTVVDGEIAAATSTRGNGGNVSIHAGSLSVSGENCGIFSSTSFSGNGGDLSIHAESLSISGENVAILASTTSSGNGGDLSLDVGSLSISGGSVVASSTTSKKEGGNGGNVTVNAESIVIDSAGIPPGFTGIFAETFNTGNGGTVAIGAGQLLLQNGGIISAASSSSAAAGSVQLRLGTLSMDAGSSISSANTGSGAAGSVFINTSGVTRLSGASSISTLADEGDAGSIKLTSSGKIKLTEQSSITASAGTNGGNITLSAPDLVYILDSSITATAGGSGGTGTGGNITIDPQFIVLNNSLISANAAAGQGGNINLVSDFFFNSNSSITATGTQNGTINITAPALDLGAQLITLPTSLLSVENQLQERCTALLQGDVSSFISIGRGGTEPAPEELQTTF